MPVERPTPPTAASPSTPLDEIAGTVQTLRSTFDHGRTRPLSWRLQQLEAIERMCDEREAEIEAALRQDLGKSHFEACATEIHYTAHEARLARKKVHRWVRPDRVHTPVVAQPGSSKIHKDPLGVVLVIAPWNYPFQLAMAPIVGATAAGNCALVKPSEVAPAVSAMLAKLLPEYLDPDAIAVVEGGVDETTELLRCRFDHIFYTGNGRVGRIVMRAAAEHLTPVTLELGGKSPTIVDRDVDLTVAARRIAWAKFTNAGQTCVAPDYVLVERPAYDAFVAEMVATVRAFYGDNAQLSEDFGRIINTRHHDRLVALLEGSTIAVGGQHDREDRFLAPTVLTDVALDSPVMTDEIFGPILPILPVDDIEAAIALINARPKPLALYLFSNDASVQRKILERTSSGSAVINHALMQMTVPGLPFGGVGNSGMGAYHGKHSFDCFTHNKAVLRKPTALDPTFMYPPYSPRTIKLLKALL